MVLGFGRLKNTRFFDDCVFSFVGQVASLVQMKNLLEQERLCGKDRSAVIKH